MAKHRYRMTISRLTVDKLGVKLYDHVSAVIAELVANCYDADATEVTVTAPMNELLSTKTGTILSDKGYTIEVSDDGSGMVPDQINRFYLIVGAERRNDPERGDISPTFQRKVMGRKGVGKLAPFGVCQMVEILSSGGSKVSGLDENGKQVRGYLTSHLYLDRREMLTDTDKEYNPKPGRLDGTFQKKRGTTIRMSIFDHRRVPPMDTLERQLSQRFGVVSPNWSIKLKDSTQTNSTLTVGSFDVDTMENTKILFTSKGGKTQVIGPDGKPMTNLSAEFEHGGTTYAVTGWIGYSKQPYKDDLMAGVRIYCRGKIAAQTHIFNLKAGFTGEYDIRSYLVGQLSADWLDEAEDLIRTDRQDILWSHELGRAFELWGQGVVKQIGALTRQPKRKKAWDTFKEKSGFDEIVRKAFPASNQEPIRENTTEIAKAIAQTTSDSELNNREQIDTIVKLSLLLGPHITLDRKLREAASENDDPLSVMNSILGTARIAELSAFGRIADDRVRVIKRIEGLKDDKATLEAAFQTLIAQAPWLINPQWSPITNNQAFSTLKSEFEKYFLQKTKTVLNLDPFADGAKRADFVLSNQDNCIEIIEIKRPKHSLENEEMGRIDLYVELMDKFLSEPGNQEFREMFPSFHVTLVCDKLGLTGVYKRGLEALVNTKRLTHINWRTFLLRTRKMHEAFLNEAERQRRDAAKY